MAEISQGHLSASPQKGDVDSGCIKVIKLNAHAAEQKE